LTGDKGRGCVRPVRRVRDGFLTLGDYALGLSEKAKTILKLLGAGNCARDVAKAVPCSKSTVNYWKNKFVGAGALRLVVKDVFKEYALTPYGSRILTTSESGFPPEVCCLEDYAVKFGLLDWGRADDLDWRKLGRPRNWEKLGVKIGNVRVVRTSRSIIVHPGRLRGFDVDELLMLSGRIVERVKGVLECNFGLVLEEPGVALHEPVTRFYSEEAGELVKLGTTIVEDVGTIDNSPPERVPHEEYVDKDLAKARLLVPLKLIRLEQRVEGVEKQLTGLSDNVSELVSVLKTALAPKSAKEFPSQPVEDRRYIS
jgi:hypothetical protein